MSDRAEFIIEEVENPWATRETIAAEYAAGIRYGCSDWPKVNAAILERYAPSGLAYIKRKAWKLNARCGAPLQEQKPARLRGHTERALA